jgi:DNA-binding CsgD family transcriptional regulator
MKAAAIVTSQVMEQISQLPGVAVLDWCDRAAAALTRVHHPCLATVAVGQVDARCVLTSMEVSGAAASQPIPDRPSTEPMPRVDLQVLRQSLREGDWIGWAFQPLAPGQWFIDSIKLGPAGQRRPASPLNMRWDSIPSGELLVGAIGLQGPMAGRVLLAELAVVGGNPQEIARHQAVFTAVLPLMGIKYVNAIGPMPADRHSWLTPREETILWKLVAGKKVPQIAAELHRSVYTVHDHVKSLHRKLGATNRGQLVSRALGHLGPLIARQEEAAEANAAREEAAMSGSRRR